MYQHDQIAIRPIEATDLKALWTLMYKDEQPEWKKWDAPYYPHSTKSYAQFLTEREAWIQHPARWVITVDGVVAGIVTYYWEHEPSKWLEMGIVLHERKNWGRGIGTVALKLWIAHLFTTLPLVRVGFTTWSGNERMMRVGEKLGMHYEARIRRVRYYNGQYYDSIRMGLLREEWDVMQ